MSEARQNEVQGNKGVLEFRGHKFEVELDQNEWSLDLMESIEEGKSVGICRGALGPAQWRVVKEMNLKVRDLTELANKIAAAMGFADAGESSASSN